MTGPRLWIVERSDSQVFIFGETVGVKAGAAWLTEAIETAFDSSDEFWCEFADAEGVARSPVLATYGLSNEPLSQRLDDDQRAALHEVAHTLGVDPDSLEGLRPWLAGQLLDHAQRAQLGIDAAVDVHGVLLARAQRAAKPINTELPDADAILAWYATLGETVELDYLMWTVGRVRDGAEEIARQATAWLVGDESVVARQLAGLREDYPGLHRKLIADRNRAWVPRIEAMLERPGRAFVLVGDLHLPGDDGVPSLLASCGLAPRRAG